MDILSRLPVWSLQRFKCVSPFWNALISDRYFIMNISIVPRMTSHRFSLSSSVQAIEDEQCLDRPPNCGRSYTLLCCCDGLILLSTLYTCTNLIHLLLGNPSTRESIVLPSREYTWRDWVYGMGYDATSDDYKILAADLNGNRYEGASVEILPLKSGSWRKISKYPTGMRSLSGYLNCGMYSLAFIHGAFHWLSESACYTIVSFNISNEEYGEIPLLERMYDNCTFRFDMGVSVLRGMLCYYNMPDIYGLSRTFKLWAMKDYGVKESWMQWLAIPNVTDLGSAVPQYMFADGDVLLSLVHLKYEHISSLYWTSKRGPFELWPERRQAIVYTESLISPKLLF